MSSHNKPKPKSRPAHSALILIMALAMANLASTCPDEESIADYGSEGDPIPAATVKCGGPPRTVDLLTYPGLYTEPGNVSSITLHQGVDQSSGVPVLYVKKKIPDTINKQIIGDPPGFKLVTLGEKFTFTPPDPPFKGEVLLKVFIRFAKAGPAGQVRGKTYYLEITVDCDPRKDSGAASDKGAAGKDTGSTGTGDSGGGTKDGSGGKKCTCNDTGVTWTTLSNSGKYSNCDKKMGLCYMIYKKYGSDFTKVADGEVLSHPTEDCKMKIKCP